MVVKENALFEETAPEVLRVEGAMYPQMVQGKKKLLVALRLFQTTYTKKKKKWEMHNFLNSCR